MANRETAGIFAPTVTYKIADITDGTSNTVIVAEVYSRGYTCTGGASAAVRRNGVGVPYTSGGIFRAAFVGAIPPWGTPINGWFTHPDGSSCTYNTWWTVASNMMTPTFMGNYGLNSFWPGAHSLHPGIVNVCMADGSTHAMSETMEWGTWRKLCSRAEGLPVPQY